MAGLLACMLSLNANAALFGDDEARRAILELRQKFDAGQQRQAEELRRATEENAQLRRSVLDLSNQIEQLRNEVARMRGQDEQMTRDISEVQRRQNDLTKGVEDRLKRMEPVKISLDGREFTAEPDETRQYEAALAALRQGDFPQAERSFAAFNQRFPNSGYKPSALFWLGNAQYAVRNYRDALTNFRTLVTVAPDHLRAPEAMLSMANSQLELKDPKAARKTLDDLIKAYPQAEAASVAKERISRLR
jgi:tol-pal system protein YbgF